MLSAALCIAQRQKTSWRPEWDYRNEGKFNSSVLSARRYRELFERKTLLLVIFIFSFSRALAHFTFLFVFVFLI